MCDLACNWKLDVRPKPHRRWRLGKGERRNRPAHGVAYTEEGPDRVEKLTEVKDGGQTVVSLELQPVRDARLKASREAAEKATRDAAERDAVDKAAREKSSPGCGNQNCEEKAQKVRKPS